MTLRRLQRPSHLPLSPYRVRSAVLQRIVDLVQTTHLVLLLLVQVVPFIIIITLPDLHLVFSHSLLLVLLLRNHLP